MPHQFETNFLISTVDQMQQAERVEDIAIEKSPTQRMKLNMRPKTTCPASPKTSLCYLLVLPFLCSAPASCQRPNVETNATGSREVIGLQLAPDFRAVKLRWRYEHSVANEPASFSIRYCELTSWSSEIKCRRKEMRVQREEDQSVMSPVDTVRQLEAGHYEAQIFDLRALTNYTFRVRVAGFVGEPGRQRQQAARQLDLGPLDGTVAGRVETKPFGAEASKCLADVSEVVISTGRYFGGRISVEGSSDARCTVLGNRSSEQSAYTLRIEHQICGSKTVDSNRIETMVLVHENKDILTHNTARFLVLCNFLQRSFTLKASVALPKVSAQLSGSIRPAVITSLQSGKSGADANASIMLGSMPGFYKSRTGEPAETGVAKRDANSTGGHISMNELADNDDTSNTIDGRESRLLKSRQTGTVAQTRARVLSLPADSNGGVKFLPQPVQVQSQLLVVERSAGTSRSMSDNWRDNGQLHRRSDTAKVPPPPPPKQSVSWEGGEQGSAPLIVTNNHRVSNHFVPVGRYEPEKGYSIKYSAARVDDYPLAEGSAPPQLVAELGGAQLRSRTARQQQLVPLEPEVDSPVDSTYSRHNWTAVNRMGDAREPDRDSLADTERPPTDRPLLANSTLAHNITSYLLKWSLKALTNLARRSIESLVSEESDGDGSNLSRESNLAGTSPAPLLLDQDLPRYKVRSNRFDRAGFKNHTTSAPHSEGIGLETSTGQGANLLDGFITGSRHTAEQEAESSQTTKAKAESSGQATAKQQARPSSYSKSIDFGRSESIPAPKRQAHSERSRVNSQVEPMRVGQVNESQHLHSEHKDLPTSAGKSSASWVLYVAALLAGLIMLAGMTLWLVYAPPVGSFGNQKRSSVERAIHPRPVILPDSSTRGAGDISYLKYDYNRLEPGIGAIGKQSLASCGTSQSLRSTSKLVLDENDCKNSEFLTTEHVLINAGSGRGESYA